MSLFNQILEILAEKKEQRASDLSELTGKSRQMVHRVLLRLLEEGKVSKLGTPPKTYYSLNTYSGIAPISKLTPQELEFLSNYFLLITETGTKLTGLEALNHWCAKQNLPLDKTANEYIKTRKKYLAYFQENGLINGKMKLINTKGFDRIGMDDVWYLDFYAIERFGKTNLGLLLHFAKQGQNRKLMSEIVELTQTKVRNFIIQNSIDAVGYIPPTIKREVQIMSVFKNAYKLSVPHINLVKVTGEIAVPQKALSKIHERISNARASIVVAENRVFKKVLLIDDAIGSGATLNETATKIKEKGIAKEVIGLAITGSFKGFDVITEI